MKILVVLSLLLIITLSFCGCTSSPSISNSGSVTSPTTTSQNPDDLYIQYIAEYANSYDQMVKPLSKLEKGASDYATIKSTWMDIQVLSKTYYEKISSLKVSSQNELSKNYYLEFLKTMQQYSETSVAAPYPKNPSNQSEYLQFDNYMTSLNSQMKTAATYNDKALNSDVCKLLQEKQNLTPPICILKSSHTSSIDVNQTSNIQVKIYPTEISQKTVTVKPEARNMVLANPTRYCIGSGGSAEWREGRSVSGIFCVNNEPKTYPTCGAGTGPYVYGSNGIICGE